MEWPSRKLCALAILALMIAGCGYHFAAAGTSLPASAETIYVAPFTNRTLDTGIQDVFARYMKDEIERHARLHVVDDPAAADLRLTGTLSQFDPYPAALNAVGEPTVYNLNLRASATLFDNRTHKVLWSQRSIGIQAPYAIVPQAVLSTSPQFLTHNFRANDIAQLTDSQTAQTQSTATQGDAMASLARSIYAQMTEGF